MVMIGAIFLPVRKQPKVLGSGIVQRDDGTGVRTLVAAAQGLEHLTQRKTVGSRRLSLSLYSSPVYLGAGGPCSAGTEVR